MTKPYTFQVVLHEVTHVGGQTTANVVRNDGYVVRYGMWPDFANADCALLNACCANGWTVERYHQERAKISA